MVKNGLRSNRLTDYNYAMERITLSELPGLLIRALQYRQHLLIEPHDSAWRLFNGFYEGFPSLVVDLYGRTLVVFTHKAGFAESQELVSLVQDVLVQRLDWISCVLLKQRSSMDADRKRGVIVLGDRPDTMITENSVTYFVDLLMNQDAGFYLDTRNLRSWLKHHAVGKTVLNTFAYTGSLGVAALAGGADRVIQIDRSARFLESAQASLGLNRLDSKNHHTKAVDFFVAAGQMRRRRESFDIVVIDPPFFSVTPQGRVDQVRETTRLVNKARPLVNDDGYLVVVNNALFVPGKVFLQELEELTSNGYLTIDEIIPVDTDVTGLPETIIGSPPADPAPFNHSTKIVVFKVRKKVDDYMQREEDNDHD